MNSKAKFNTKLIFLITLFGACQTSLAQINYKPIEGMIKACGMRILSKKYEKANDQLIIETGSTRAFGRGSFIVVPFDQSVGPEEYEQIDSLLALRFAGNEILSSSRAGKRYGMLYTYLVKNTADDNSIVHRFAIRNYHDEVILFGYSAPIKRSWGLLERFECIVKRMD